MKKVVPHNDWPWLMLLAVDFATNKVFAWDLELDQGDLEHVQAVILRFFQEQELPVIAWSDNGGPFRNVIEAVLEQTLGVKPRHILPGRPQANGLVEVFNRIMDAAHQGERNRLMSAVLA